MYSGRAVNDFRCLIPNALAHPCLPLHWMEAEFVLVGIFSGFELQPAEDKAFKKIII